MTGWNLHNFFTLNLYGLYWFIYPRRLCRLLEDLHFLHMEERPTGILLDFFLSGFHYRYKMFNFKSTNLSFSVFVLGVEIMNWQGAATTCYVALHPGVKGVTGKYFVDCNELKPSSFASKKQLARKLWDFSNNMINSISKP